MLERRAAPAAVLDVVKSVLLEPDLDAVGRERVGDLPERVDRLLASRLRRARRGARSSAGSGTEAAGELGRASHEPLGAARVGSSRCARLIRSRSTSSSPYSSSIAASSSSRGPPLDVAHEQSDPGDTRLGGDRQPLAQRIAAPSVKCPSTMSSDVRS